MTKTEFERRLREGQAKAAENARRRAREQLDEAEQMLNLGLPESVIPDALGTTRLALARKAYRYGYVDVGRLMGRVSAIARTS